MTNEWEEFKAYTGQPVYTAANKHDTAFYSRVTLNMIAEFSGFGRVFTIIARGYLFHDKDGGLFNGNPYDRIDYARNALFAWCSVPEKKKSSVPPTDFRELSADFPELVDGDGKGWLYRHAKNLFHFIRKNPDLVNKQTSDKLSGISKGFTRQWKKRVKQFQVPLFSLNDKGAWTLRFDGILADALEAGPLRTEECVLPQSVSDLLDNTDLNGVPRYAVEDVLRFYFANRTDDTPWVVLPVETFDAYYGNTNFSRKWLSKLPKEIVTREYHRDVSRISANTLRIE